MKKAKLLALAALVLLPLLLLRLLQVGRTDRREMSTGQAPGTQAARPQTALEVARSNAAPLILNFWRTNAALAQLSSNNVAFQEWGKAFMLRVANDHLSKSPLFGLKGPLRTEDVSIQTLLTTSGAEINLDTL